MPKIKWSAFPNAGELQTGDIIVGLRGGTNVQLTPVTPEDVQVSLFNYSLATGSNDAFVATLNPPATSLTDGLLVTLNTGALTNLTGTPTLQVNALPAKTIDYNNLQLLPGDLETNNTYVLVYNSNTNTFNLVNPSVSAANTELAQYNEYNAAVDSGVANAYIANLTPPATSLTGFLSVLCKIGAANTGASTLTVNGNTAPIVTANNQALVGGELIANQVALFLYDATWASFILVNPSNNVTTLLPVVNHRVARFSGTSGRIENSSATLANTGVLTLTADAVVHTINIGLGAGNIATNTRVGVSALGANTTGARNVAIGYQTLQSSNAANSSDNVVIGSSAAPSATTIYNMTLLGSNAGLSYTTSNNSVSVGTNALRTATTGGDRSVAIGVNALYTTNGAVNTAVGYRAGEAFTGNNGLFIGGNAGVLTTGGDNTIIGVDAATALTTGANNTLIGRQAGSSQTTGSNNSAIGYGSGASGATGATAITTGTYNTLLGYQSCPNAADATGTIGIGANAVPEKATGATSANNGPGIAIGSASYPVGFRGDGTIYTGGTGRGYMRPKINGTNYFLPLFVAGTSTIRAAMVTDTNGSPILSSSMADGQVIIGSSSGTPTAATLTAGSNITITNTANSITIASSLTGSVRAWVNFNGTVTPITITGSGNVTSITDGGVGVYTVNFTNALASATYSAVATNGNVANITSAGSTLSTTACSVEVWRRDSSNVAADANPVSFAAIL